jgi:4-amino-4-deoxy-L-arabinose transferase-like glycosyltransferase
MKVGALLRRALWTLLVIASAVYFVRLGAASVWDANEAFYVETPREMLEAHDLINPSFNYLPRFNKPVLSYWLVAGLYKVFGVSVTAQRLGIAIGAAVIIACAFALGRAAGFGIGDSGFGIRDSGFEDQGLGIRDSGFEDQGLGMRDSAALWSATALAAAPRLVMFARRIFIDVWLTAFMALTLTCFALSERYPEQRRRYLVFMYVSVGLGILTKGPVAVVLPALAFALYLIVHRELARVTRMMLPAGIVIVAAIVLPWYAALYHEHGWMQIRSFLVSENLERYTAGVGVRQIRGPLFYLPVVLTDSFPCSLLLVPAAALWFRERDRVQSLLWCWIAAIVAFFTFSAGKQDLYIFPIVPAVAGLAGVALARARTDMRMCRIVVVTLAVTGALLALGAGAVLYLFEATGRIYALQGSAAIGAFGVTGGLLAIWLALRRRPAVAGLVILSALIAINLVFVTRVLPDFERYKPVPDISDVLRPRLKPGDVVAQYKVALPSMVYYLGRHVDSFEGGTDEFVAFFRGHHGYAILWEGDYAALRPVLGKTCEVGHWDVFQAKLKDILSQQPLPRVVAVYNACEGQ